MKPPNDLRYLRYLIATGMLLATMSASNEAASQTPFSLTISPSEGSAEYVPLLPVIVTIELKNVSTTTQSIAGAGLDVVERSEWEDPPRYSFQIIQPDGTFRSAFFCDWVNWTVDGPHMANPPQSLGPGCRQILDFLLGFGFQGTPDRKMRYVELLSQSTSVFPETGEYHVWLLMPRLKPAAVASNALKITVKQPEKPNDIQAYDILSHSHWPNIFLSPLVVPGGAQGISAVPDLPDLRGYATTMPLETCKEILNRCPDSAYAPYAKAYLATAVIAGWKERVVPTKPEILPPERRIEGARLLRQVAEDPRLPRRYREQALLNLSRGAEEINRVLQRNGTQKRPSLENILGGVKVDTADMGDNTILKFVYRMTQGTLPKDVEEKFLKVKFTADQLEAIRKVVVSDANIATAIGVTPVQKELESLIGWAERELRKIPWRDPNTGQLTMAAIPSSSP